MKHITGVAVLALSQAAWADSITLVASRDNTLYQHAAEWGPDPREFAFLTLDTRTPHTTDFEGDRRRQDGPLHPALGQRARPEGPVVGDGERDDRGVTGCCTVIRNGQPRTWSRYR